MSWQDIVISGGTVFIILGLLPSVFSDDKPALWTCITVTVIIFGFSITFASLDLWVTAAVNLVQAFIWLTLLIQQLLRKRVA